MLVYDSSKNVMNRKYVIYCCPLRIIKSLSPLNGIVFLICVSLMAVPSSPYPFLTNSLQIGLEKRAEKMYKIRLLWTCVLCLGLPNFRLGLRILLGTNPRPVQSPFSKVSFMLAMTYIFFLCLYRTFLRLGLHLCNTPVEMGCCVFLFLLPMRCSKAAYSFQWATTASKLYQLFSLNLAAQQ